MKIIKMDKAVLIQKMTTNRSTHEDYYNRAMQGYSKTLHDKIDKLAKKSKASNNEKIRKLVMDIVQLPVPEVHLDDYDTALAMLADEVDDTVTLTREEYESFVEDRWDWKRRFVGSTQAYLVG